VKIAFESSCLTKQLTGIGLYTYHLVKEMSLLYPDNHLILLANKLNPNNYSFGSNVDYLTDVGFSSFLWNNFKLPWILKKQRPCLFHGTNFMLPLTMVFNIDKTPGVNTVHDMSSFVMSHTHV
jgi:hypothetical protein